MEKSLRYSLLTEMLTRLSSQMAYTALLVIAYDESHQTIELGFVSVGIVLPSLLFVRLSAYINTPNRAWIAFGLSSAARIAVLVSVVFVGRNWIFLAAVAGIIGLTQQIIQTAKMTLDTWIVPSNQRVSFSSSKATAGSLAIMVGPPLAGALAGVFGSGMVLIVVAVLGLLSILAMVPVRPHLSLVGKTAPEMSSEGEFGRFSLLEVVCRFPAVAVSFGTYIVVLIILEMESPLLFPFVNESYGLGAEFAGYLLGACGLGSFVGALFMHRWGRPFTPVAITVILIFDGVTLMLATHGVSLSALFGLLSFFGVISSVTLVSTETQIQNVVPPDVAAPLFSLMSFAGGAGGAAMTLVSTAVAQELGAGRALFASGGVEVLAGLGSLGAIWKLTTRYKKGIK
jgi:predicted MFS family arabinose efflux permease